MPKKKQTACDSCTSNYRDSSFKKDHNFCEKCGRELIEKEHVLNSHCQKCGKRKIYLYKECPVRSASFFDMPLQKIKETMDFEYHSNDLIETYSR